MKFKKLIKIGIFPLAVFVIHLIFYRFKVYPTFPFLDIPMHFFGGMALAFAFIELGDYFNFDLKKSGKIISIFCFTSLILIFVEFMEFLIFSPYKLGLVSLIPDTVGDLFFGVAGCVVLVSLKSDS